MSDQDTNQDVTNTSSVQQQNMVPKERLDELISQRRLLEEQNQVLQQILRSAVPAQQAAPKPEPEYLVRLKEENPAAYAALVSQDQKLTQQASALFAFGDNQDQMRFLQEFGDEGKKYLDKVEGELKRLRDQGISTYNRGQLFIHMKGVEALKSPVLKQEIAQQTAQAQVKIDAQNVPSQNPETAGTTARGSASATPSRKTLEDLERDLKDVTF